VASYTGFPSTRPLVTPYAQPVVVCRALSDEGFFAFRPYKLFTLLNLWIFVRDSVIGMDRSYYTTDCGFEPSLTVGSPIDMSDRS